MDGPDEDLEKPSRPAWHWWLGAVVLAVAVAGGWYLVTSGGGEAAPPAAAELNFAEVVRTDLVTVETLDGTLGYTAGDFIRASRTGTLTGLAAEGSTVAQGDVLFSIDGEPVVLLYGELPAWRGMGLTEEERPLLARSAGTLTSVAAEDSEVGQGETLFTVDGRPVVLLHGDTPAWRTMEDDDIGQDVLQLETALVALGYDPNGTVTVDEEFTARTEDMVERWQEDLGFDDDDVDGVVRFGDVVFLPEDAVVRTVLTEAGSPVQNGSAVLGVLDTVETVEGVDVLQLETALVAIGFDAGGAVRVDRTFTADTEEAVIAWQRSIGADDDGVVDLGEVVFLPGPVRIGEELLDAGAGVGGGGAVLATSSTGTLVRLGLPTDQQDLIDVGDQVVVVMPDDTEEPAVVTEIGTVAVTDASGESTFEVTIALLDAEAAFGLDEAPVEVEVVDEERRGVLAVPVTALLALSEGGYALELDAGGGQTRLVPVEPGLYADGFVEVEGAGLGVGDRVVVP